MAIKCNKCGFDFNPDGTNNCSICNSSLILPATQSLPVNRKKTVKKSKNSNFNNKKQSKKTTPINKACNNISINKYTPAVLSSKQAFLEGRINHVERQDEKPPLDIYNILSKVLLFILIGIPFITLFICFGFISLAFAVIGFHAVSQLFNPIIWTTTIAELLEVLVLRRIRGTDTVPIYRGMVEDKNNQEYSFWFRGPIKSGNLIIGHKVKLIGNWRGGTYFVKNGFDLDINSDITSRYRNP